MSSDHHLAFLQRIGRRLLPPSVWFCKVCLNKFKHSKHASPTLRPASTSILATPRVLHPATRQVHRPVLPKHHPHASVAHKAVILVTIVSSCRLTRSRSSSFMCRPPVDTVSTRCPQPCQAVVQSSVSRSGSCHRLNRPSPNTSSRPSPVRTARKPCGRSVQQSSHQAVLDPTLQPSLHCCMVATA